MNKQILTDVRDTLLDVIENHNEHDLIGCIAYVFDASNADGYGTGFHTGNCDIGDALVAMRRIAEQFNITMFEDVI